MAEWIFWISVFVILYTYLGFPLLTFLRSRVRRARVVRGDITPTLSLIVVAHNEEQSIANKLDNTLMLDYPKDRLQVVVASDGSDDATDAIVESYQDRGIKLLRLPRRGKIPALNDAAATSAGEILVFSDASNMYARDALRMLVRSFADHTVGGVAGNQRYVCDGKGGKAGDGERAYWNFDQLLKLWQSAAGSVTSATGAIYAIRRELFQAVPAGVCDDALISYRVIARGYRLIFEPAAIADEWLSPSAGAEFKRKVRVCARGLRALRAIPSIFNPFRHGFYSLQLFSHKLLRWMMVWPLLFLLASSLWLSRSGMFYQIALIAQAAFYTLVLAGFFVHRRGSMISRIINLPFYFCLVNAACLVAQFRVARGEQTDLWKAGRSKSKNASKTPSLTAGSV